MELVVVRVVSRGNLVLLVQPTFPTAGPCLVLENTAFEASGTSDSPGGCLSGEFDTAGVAPRTGRSHGECQPVRWTFRPEKASRFRHTAATRINLPSQITAHVGVPPSG